MGLLETTSIMEALRSPRRLAIVRLLLTYNSEHTASSLTVDALSSRMGLLPAAASYHLRILANAGLVEYVAIKGRRHYWRIKDEARKKVENVLKIVERVEVK